MKFYITIFFAVLLLLIIYDTRLWILENREKDDPKKVQNYSDLNKSDQNYTDLNKSDNNLNKTVIEDNSVIEITNESK